MRQLNLHVSALSDDEFPLFTSSLADLTYGDDTGDAADDDERLERLAVGVREARAWLRGRFAHVPVADIDAIIKLLDLGPTEKMSGGQFFAALRLVVHAENGKGVDRTLAFVQSHPGAPSRPVSPPKRVLSNHPPPPIRRPTAPPTPLPPSNPFSPPASSPAPQVPSAQTSPLTAPLPPPPPLEPPPKRRPVSQATNPFVARAANDTPSSSSKSPPLPPRKPVTPNATPARPAIAPRHTSVLVPNAPSIAPSVAPSVVSAPAAVTAPPPPPPLPQKLTHVTSTLMRQSLQASKAAQTMKKAEEQLEKERVWQVIKRSTGARSVSPAKSSGSDERAPPLPRRRAAHSPPLSTSSLEQVAGAALPSTSAAPRFLRAAPPASAFRAASPDQPEHPAPPPTHPDRKPPLPPPTPTPTSFESVYGTPTVDTPAETPEPSPTTRVFRSKSLHHSPPPVPPPLRKRRPESVQYVPADTGASAGSRPGAPLSRHVSLSGAPSAHRRDTSGDAGAGLSGLQRTLAGLQPRLDKARFKAEAGLSRRGFVSHAHGLWREEGGEGLMARGVADSDDDEDAGVDSADEDLRAAAARLRSREVGVDGSDAVEQDNLKWPAGEGWKPL